MPAAVCLPGAVRRKTYQSKPIVQLFAARSHCRQLSKLVGAVQWPPSLQLLLQCSSAPVPKLMQSKLVKHRCALQLGVASGRWCSNPKIASGLVVATASRCGTDLAPAQQQNGLTLTVAVCRVADSGRTIAVDRQWMEGLLLDEMSDRCAAVGVQSSFDGVCSVSVHWIVEPPAYAQATIALRASYLA